MTRIIALSLLTLGAILLLADSQKEPFALGKYSVQTTGHRRDPHPNWVGLGWDPRADVPYLALRQELTKVFADSLARDMEGRWAAKTRVAFQAWKKDCQNPLHLATASAYLGAAKVLDPKFEKAADYHKMLGYLNIGWMILRKPPNSYEFVRRAYIFNAGDTDYHFYGDLAFRLLDRDPYDRAVAIAMVHEYWGKKPEAKFEVRLFRALDIVSQRPEWRPWDDFHVALAFRLYGRNHRKKEAYDTALAKAESARRKTPPGWDAAWLDKWIETVKKEREDPLFGRFPNGKYLDDIDPPGELARRQKKTQSPPPRLIKSR